MAAVIYQFRSNKIKEDVGYDEKGNLEYPRKSLNFINTFCSN